MKMSKSEAGKIGALKSSKVNALRKQERIDLYQANPKQCKCCDKGISYERRNNLFCDSSCAATFNNTGQVRRKQILVTCLNCNKVAYTKYCSNYCQKEYEYKASIEAWLKDNIKPGWASVKRYLNETVGYKCAECGISEYNNKPIVLEMEHKDGNSLNNSLDNLCYLCPNCHSQTPTYKNKNKGNGRHSRMKRYREGKSY